jgi:uncharacterized protein (TIGR02145 family)
MSHFFTLSAKLFAVNVLVFFVAPFTAAAQIDFADTINVGTKEYINLDFQGILDSLDVLEEGSLTPIDRFLHEETLDKYYRHHDYEMLMLALDELSFTCGTMAVSFDGYDYSTVQIGDQCWFAENCRYLPEVSPSSEGNTTDPYYYVSGYEGTDVEAAKATVNYETYGVLYNWPAVMTEGICPSGWHIPSDGEFTQLTDFLGGEGVAGGKMKDDVQWDGSNSSGFNGLPGGYCSSGGVINNGHHGLWWSASDFGSYSWDRQLNKNDGSVYRYGYAQYYGESARCVRD